eukprot:COSAG06_NODE_14361_length_1163_cov_0.936090_1_plen_112_part_10
MTPSPLSKAFALVASVLHAARPIVLARVRITRGVIIRTHSDIIAGRWAWSRPSCATAAPTHKEPVDEHRGRCEDDGEHVARSDEADGREHEVDGPEGHEGDGESGRDGYARH